MNTTQIEIPADQKVNIEHLAIDVKDALGAGIHIARTPRTVTRVDERGSESIEKLGYLIEIPADIEEQVKDMIGKHKPQMDDAEAAEAAAKNERVVALIEIFKLALHDSDFIKILREAIKK